MAVSGGATQAEQRAVEDLMKGFSDAFNAKDATALAALFSEDAEFVNIFGGRMRGRNEIQAGHAGFFAHALDANHLVMDPDPDVKLLTPDLLLAHAHWTRERLPDAPEGTLPPSTGVLTLVVRQNAGHWELVAATNVQAVAPVARP